MKNSENSSRNNTRYFFSSLAHIPWRLQVAEARNLLLRYPCPRPDYKYLLCFPWAFCLSKLASRGHMWRRQMKNLPVDDSSTDRDRTLHYWLVSPRPCVCVRVLALYSMPLLINK